MQLGSVAVSPNNSNPFSSWAASLFTYLQAPVNASYDIYLAADNGAMLYIDNTLLVTTSKEAVAKCRLHVAQLLHGWV